MKGARPLSICSEADKHGNAISTKLAQLLGEAHHGEGRGEAGQPGLVMITSQLRKQSGLSVFTQLWQVAIKRSKNEARNVKPQLGLFFVLLLLKTWCWGAGGGGEEGCFTHFHSKLQQIINSSSWSALWNVLDRWTLEGWRVESEELSQKEMEGNEILRRMD